MSFRQQFFLLSLSAEDCTIITVLTSAFSVLADFLDFGSCILSHPFLLYNFYMLLLQVGTSYDTPSRKKKTFFGVTLWS
jgi:hypothetical protein